MGGNPSTVLVLRLQTKRTDFHPDFAALHLDFHDLPGHRGPLDLVFPEAKRARLFGQEPGESGRRGRAGQDRNNVAGTSFFAYDRHQPGVESACAHECFDRVGEDFPGDIVYVGFENDKILVAAKGDFGRRTLPPPRL